MLQGDALDDGQTGGQLRVPGGKGVTPGQDVLYRLSLLLDCRELMGKVLDSVTEEATL